MEYFQILDFGPTENQSTMETLLKKQTYLERKRAVILNLGYDFIAYKSRAKKSLRTLKEQIITLQS